jgi:diaminopimelate decarboxylase
MTAHQEARAPLSFSTEISTAMVYPDFHSLEGGYASLLTAYHSKKIFELIKGIGSPLHCVFPQQFLENITVMQAVLNKHRLSTKIFFAKKANKAQCFVKACRDANIGIDVASKQEMELALAAGITGENLSVSGPEKDIALLQLAIFQGAQIAVDSLEELQKLIGLTMSRNDGGVDISRHQLVKPVITLRFQPDCETDSRFGITSAQLPNALNTLKTYQHCITLSGFSFHLSGYDIQKRAAVTSELVKWIIAARDLDFSCCNQINIGGGLPVKYAHSDKWIQFQHLLKPEHFHRNQSFTNGFYPYGNELHSAEALDLLLSSPTSTHPSLAQQLRENNIQLAMEPGRALLNQAGVSIFSIQGMKLIDSDRRYWIATVAGMSFSLSEQWFGSEFLLSPSLLQANVAEDMPQLAEQKIFPTAVAGNSCLESDMVSWRKIPFSIKPAINDCLVYPNTAGYQMDSNESCFHSVPIIPKVAMWFDEQHLHWQVDSNI